MKRTLLAIILIFSFQFSIFCFATTPERRDSINVWGKVSDLFTGDEIDKGTLTVYDEADSIVVI
ncbi:MAG: hypothetical protein J5729_01435, partial [Bacteroidaceae bacterium]|nr:hypothetical protein [Bacteroidaceae bacterium]